MRTEKSEIVNDCCCDADIEQSDSKQNNDKKKVNNEILTTKETWNKETLFFYSSYIFIRIPALYDGMKFVKRMNVAQDPKHHSSFNAYDMFKYFILIVRCQNFENLAAVYCKMSIENYRVLIDRSETQKVFH